MPDASPPAEGYVVLYFSLPLNLHVCCNSSTRTKKAFLSSWQSCGGFTYRPYLLVVCLGWLLFICQGASCTGRITFTHTHIYYIPLFFIFFFLEKNNTRHVASRGADRQMSGLGRGIIASNEFRFRLRFGVYFSNLEINSRIQVKPLSHDDLLRCLLYTDAHAQHST